MRNPNKYFFVVCKNGMKWNEPFCVKREERFRRTFSFSSFLCVSAFFFFFGSLFGYWKVVTAEKSLLKKDQNMNIGRIADGGPVVWISTLRWWDPRRGSCPGPLSSSLERHESPPSIGEVLGSTGTRWRRTMELAQDHPFRVYSVDHSHSGDRRIIFSMA